MPKGKPKREPVTRRVIRFTGKPMNIGSGYGTPKCCSSVVIEPGSDNRRSYLVLKNERVIKEIAEPRRLSAEDWYFTLQGSVTPKDYAVSGAKGDKSRITYYEIDKE